MAGKKVTYIFARFNVAAKFENKIKFVFEGLNKQNTITHKEYKWGFYDVELTSTAELEGHFIHGFLVKFQDMKYDERVDKKQHKIVVQGTPDRIVSKARFFLHVESGMIAFHVNREIQKDIFIKRFSEVFEAAYGNFFVSSDIFPIDQERQFLDAIGELDAVKKVNVKLRPSNPSFQDSWKKVDQRIKDMHLSSYSEIYEVDPRKNSIHIDSELTSKLQMVDDGYGKAAVAGVKDNQNVIVTSSRTPETEKIDSSYQDPVSILSNLISRFSKIFSRFRH